ncbi:MAG: IS200/IS605 family transposase [Nitrospirota bacterium]
MLIWRMGLKRTSHAVYDTKYHLVWCPKYRKALFAQKYLCERAVELFREIAEEYEYDIEEMEVAKDHVHIFLSFPPRYSIGEVVRALKSISARELFREYPSLKKRLWAGELWEDGYFVRTVGDKLTSAMIEKYIRCHRDEKQSPAQIDFHLR